MMCGVTKGGSTEQRLEASFELFDANGDGVVSKDEVRAMLIMLMQQKVAMARFQTTGRRTAASAVVLDDKTLSAIDGIVKTTFEKVDTDKVCALHTNALLLFGFFALAQSKLSTRTERHHRQGRVHPRLFGAPRRLLLLQAVLSGLASSSSPPFKHFLKPTILYFFTCHTRPRTAQHTAFAINKDLCPRLPQS